MITTSRMFQYNAMTSEDLQNSNFTKDYFEFRKVLFSRNEHVRYLTCGSFFEMPLLYFLSNPTDVDIMFCDTTLLATDDHVNVPARLARSVLTIDTSGCYVGYARLRNGREYFRKYKDDVENGPALTHQISIETSCLGAVLGKIYHRWGSICMVSKDNVYALSCPLWPQDAREWITRKRINDWPSKETIIEIVKGGCHLVSKSHAKDPNDDTQWRYSFSQAETVLIHNSWTDVQKYIYHLLRIIKRDVVNKCGGEDKTFISNYYVKTLMLWACEEKSSQFWEENNIVTSVGELLLDFIGKLMDRNVPHYFMSANNIMDDMPRNADFENEIRSLREFREDEILELVRMQPKAHQITSGFIVMPNQSLYPLLGLLSRVLYLPAENKIANRQLQESKMLSFCSSNHLFPELEYLYKGIITHLQLSKLKNYENKKRREEFITSAEDLFDTSVQKLDYGFTRFRFYLGWSISEFYQQLCLLCGVDNVHNQNLMLYSSSCVPNTTSTSCYVRDEDEYLKGYCSSTQNRMDTTYISTILQQVILREITLPFNSTYFVCSAYRANFFYNALCNYRRALDLCKEAYKQLSCLTAGLCGHLFTDLVPFPLKHEWWRLYDKDIQILLGFFALYRAATNRERMTPVYISSVKYLGYIYTRCGRVLGEPVRPSDFGFDCKGLRLDSINIILFRDQFTNAILRTALSISEPHLAYL